MSYPKNLQHSARFLQNYSRNTFTQRPYRTESVKPGETIVVDLPTNSIIDLDTLCFHFKGTTAGTTDAAEFPKNIESIIERMTLNFGSHRLLTPSETGEIYNMKWFMMQGSDVKSKRALYQKANGVPAATLLADETSVPYKIQHWLSIGEMKNKYWDTAVMGQTSLHIQLKPAVVLAQEAATTAVDYTLDDLKFTYDAISIDDGAYHQATADFLAAGGVFEIPYKNYWSIQQNNTGWTQSTRFSVSTGSLDMLWATFRPSDYNSVGVLGPQNTKTSNYYKFLGSVAAGSDEVQTYSFMVNNVQHPVEQADLDDAFALTMNATNMSQDVLGGIDADISTPAIYEQEGFVVAQKFNHDDEGFVSGLNMLGTNSQMEFRTRGVGSSANVSLVVAETTSVIRVGANRSIDVQP